MGKLPASEWSCVPSAVYSPAPHSFQPSPLLAWLQNARAVADPEQQQQMLEEGDQAADFIRTSIVQAGLNERGAYGMRRPQLPPL